jgi:prefoldin subunit 5
MPQLEAAMTSELIPYKQELVRESTMAGIEDVVVRTTELIEARLANIQDQIEELESLRGKNKDVISHMMVKANQDKLNFDKGLAQFQALRNVFSQHAQQLRATLGMETLRSHVHKTRVNMEKSYFTKGIRSAMKDFFMVIRENMSKAANQVEEIQTMMAAMYRKFSEDHGLAAVSPPVHSMLKFHKEIQRLERKFDERFNTVFHMITQEQHLLTARFFETLASEVVKTWEIANRETEGWMRALMAPMDTQVREHQSQLKRRLESVKRIHEATETLDHRIQELEASSGASAAQLEALAYINNQVIEALNTPAQSEHAYARSA